MFCISIMTSLMIFCLGGSSRANFFWNFRSRGRFLDIFLPLVVTLVPEIYWMAKSKTELWRLVKYFKRAESPKMCMHSSKRLRVRKIGVAIEIRNFCSIGIAAVAFANTNLAGASACIVWVLFDAIQGKVSISGACAGLIVGLATGKQRMCFSAGTLLRQIIWLLILVTPAAGYVQPGYGLLIGCIGSVIVYWWLKLRTRFLHFDDTLDVFSCHGMSGIVGTFCTGLFCQLDVNPQGANGAFFGNPLQLWKQIAAILVVNAFISFSSNILSCHV